MFIDFIITVDLFMLERDKDGVVLTKILLTVDDMMMMMMIKDSYCNRKRQY
jgi:hypothetical protein